MGSDDERAVSPVIGVILMVAITVILAAVIAAFVLDMGDMGGSAPTADINFDQAGQGSSATVTIEHTGGEALNNEQITVVADTEDTAANLNWGSSDEISAGDSIDVGDGAKLGSDLDGETVQVIWQSDSGESQVLAEYEVN